MDKINLTMKFELASGEKGSISVKDVSEFATDQQILDLASYIIAGNTKIKGSKPVKMYSCTKATILEEELVKKP